MESKGFKISQHVCAVLLIVSSIAVLGINNYFERSKLFVAFVGKLKKNRYLCRRHG